MNRLTVAQLFWFIRWVIGIFLFSAVVAYRLMELFGE